MSFAEQAPIARRQHHPERAAVFQPERQRLADQRNIGDFEIRGSFDPVQPRDRHAVAFEHSLIARDRVPHPSKNRVFEHEIAGSRQLLDELEGRALHPFILATFTFCHTRVIRPCCDLDLQNSPFYS